MGFCQLTALALRWDRRRRLPMVVGRHLAADHTLRGKSATTLCKLEDHLQQTVALPLHNQCRALPIPQEDLHPSTGNRSLRELQVYNVDRTIRSRPYLPPALIVEGECDGLLEVVL